MTSDQGCRRCGAEMHPSIALAQTLSAGAPDLGGSDAVIDCMKCSACGWSVTSEERD